MIQVDPKLLRLAVAESVKIEERLVKIAEAEYHRVVDKNFNAEKDRSWWSKFLDCGLTESSYTVGLRESMHYHETERSLRKEQHLQLRIDAICDMAEASGQLVFLPPDCYHLARIMNNLQKEGN